MNPAPKVITGRLHPDNKAACDWGFQGFLAYGCHGYTVVIDPKTLQIIQTVGPQKGNITCVRWSSEDYHHAFATGSTYSLHLACADTSGSVIIWDVTTGQVRSQLIHSQPGKGFVLGMEWIRGHSESNDLLLILRGPDILEMWDGFSGVKLWKKCFTDNILSFSLDPFSMDRLVLLSESPQLLVCTDICTIKEPSDNYTVIPFSDPNPSIPAAGSKRKLPSNSSSSSSLAKMASLASNMILSSTSEQLRKRSSVVEEEYLTSCIQATCSAAHQHLVLLVFASEIQMHDIDVGMVISTIRLDKSSPNFTKVIACQTVDMLFCLHDNGSASVRVRKQTNSARQKKLSCTDTMLDMTYELRCQSDSLRLLHHSKVFSFNFNPVSEKQMALLLSDSRLIILDIVMTNYSKPQEMLRRNLSTTLADVIAGTEVVSLPSMCRDTQDKITLQLVTSGLVSGVMSPVTIVTMLPAAGDNHAVDVQMALGSESGCIQLVNVYSGQVEHEYKLFMWPVRGIECIDHQSLLVYTYPDPPSYGNRKIKTDLITLDIKSGRTFCFFEGHEGKGPILMTTISPSRLYVAVVYKDKAMELWNINTRQLVREMILDVLVKPVHATWYNMVSTLPKNQSLMDNNGRNKTVEKRVVVEQLFVSGLLADNSSIVRIAFHDGIMAKINLFPMDMLFGAQSGRVEIVCMTYQSHYLVLADRVGQLYITDAYQTDKGAKKIQERRGFEVVAIKFAPGKMNMCFMVQYTDSIIIWELIVDKLNAAIVTSNPPLSCELVSATWAGPESVVMATEDGCLHVMDMSNKMPSSPDITDKDDFFHVKDISMKQTNSPISKWKLPAPIFSLALLEPKLAFLLKYSLQTNIQPFHPSVQQYMDLIDRDVVKYIQDETTSVVDRCYTVARVFGDEFDMCFWQLLKYMSLSGKLDNNHLRDIRNQLDIMELLPTADVILAQTNDLLDPVTSHNDDDGETGKSQGDMDISWLQDVNCHCGLTSAWGDLMNDEDFKVYETAKLALHNRRRNTNVHVKEICSRRYIITSKLDMAVQLLMETDTEHPHFKSDCFKACLSACIQHTSNSLSTMKLAATHLIAAGYLTDGVDLLCLIDRRFDACKYLISYGKWKEAIWVAKTSLTTPECVQIMCKWTEYLWNSCSKTKAMLVMLSEGQYVSVLQMLCEQRMYDTAALFLHACIQQGFITKSHQTDDVYVEFAKLLTVVGYEPAIKHYCHLAGEKGTSLLQDLRL